MIRHRLVCFLVVASLSIGCSKKEAARNETILPQEVFVPENPEL